MTLTSTEAAEALGIKAPALWKLVERGRLVPIRPGAKPLTFWAKDVYDLQVERRTLAEIAEHDALWAEVDRLLLVTHS